MFKKGLLKEIKKGSFGDMPKLGSLLLGTEKGSFGDMPKLGSLLLGTENVINFHRNNVKFPIFIKIVSFFDQEKCLK